MGTAKCSAIEAAFIEISTADAQSDDRYCGANLAQTADGTTTSAANEGLIYGKFIKQVPLNVLFIFVSYVLKCEIYISSFQPRNPTHGISERTHFQPINKIR